MVEKKENEDELHEEKQITDWDLPLSFTKDRHTDVIEGVNAISQTWRMKERVRIVNFNMKRYISNNMVLCQNMDLTSNYFQMKTVSVALVLCLNVGVDPPDIVKTQPCARLECWIGKYIFQIVYIYVYLFRVL